VRAWVWLACSAVVLGVGPGVDCRVHGECAEAEAPVKQGFIDELIRAKWEAEKIRPSGAASDPEFVRRAYLDVLGRIPNLSETIAFLENKEANKRAKLVEVLLGHPDYAKHFADQWANLLIGRRPTGNRVDAAALKSWLRKRFGENLPWNETAYELITARGSNKENGAANYVLAHMQDGAVNLTSLTTRVFLGQQIQCTQCHDHKSNDWKQDDFWGINAFFKGLRSREVTRSTVTGNEEYDYTEVYDEPTDSWATFDRSNATVGIAYPKYLDGRKVSKGTDVDRRKALGDFIAGGDNKQLALAFVNRLWGHFMGRGFVQPVDDFGDHNPPSHPELLERLAEEFMASGWDVKALVRWIMNSEAYQLASTVNSSNEKDDVLYSHKYLRPMTPEQLFDSLIVATAAHRSGGDGGREADARRREWLNQFVVAFQNDEENEGVFQGTIPQALMMMNGELMARATDADSGGILSQIIEQSQRQRRPAEYLVNRLYLAALSRPPTAAELRRAGGFFTSFPDTKGVVEDLFWSLLNSGEFILNH
jgi:hypothetical protein